MRKYVFLTMLAMIVALPDIAAAQGQGSNGGLVVKSQGHPIEFVRNGLDIAFYVGDDDGSLLSTKDMRGRAMIQDSGKTITVALTPASPNMMTGKLQNELTAKAVVVFSASLHGHSLTARYAPK